jgi:hypothetical protein
MPRQKKIRASLLDMGHKSNLRPLAHTSAAEIASLRLQ